MLGGYQILDLRNIDLSRSTTANNITDVEVLKQLSNIADHIQKNYDFSKPLHNQLKPLLIRYRDKKVGEKHEVALYGNIEVINVYYKFKIIAQNNGEKLTIDVEFEEKTDEYDNKYFSIKTATMLLTSEVAIFENITDKDGHKRFLEGDIELSENMPEGVTLTYGKWSLSGTHLMLVLAGNIANGTELINSANVCELTTLPSWIVEKIYPVFNDVIERKKFDASASSWGTQILDVALRKNESGVFIRLASGLTLTADRGFRIAFDLLIDNESQD